jgi:hypothetical protein
VLPAYLPGLNDRSVLPQCGQFLAVGESIIRLQLGQNRAPHCWQMVAWGSLMQRHRWQIILLGMSCFPFIEAWEFYIKGKSRYLICQVWAGHYSRKSIEDIQRNDFSN